MPPHTSPTSFPPTPLSLLNNCRSDNSFNLRLLQEHSHYNTYIPYGWGFTIYRAAFGPGSDERFAAGLKRLDAWLRFNILKGRYNRSGEEPDRLLVLSGLDPSALLAEQLWNEPVEEYPDKEKNVSGGGVEEGDEDFMPVGRAFVRWGDELGVELTDRNARYQHCLVLDDAALDSILGGLPEEVPEVKPQRPLQEKQELLRIMFQGPWVWVIDRETVLAREAGVRRAPEDVRPPWIRIRLGSLQTLWFKRLMGHILQPWWDLCEEDEVKPDRVFYWYAYAKMRNQNRRQFRAQMEAAGSSS